MVQHYVRKSTRQSWAADAMESVIQEVASGVSVRSAARHHNIPRNTLKRRVQKKNKQAHGSDKSLFHCSDDLHDLLAFCDDAMGRQQQDAEYEFRLLLLERETYRNVTSVPNMVPVSTEHLSRSQATTVSGDIN